MGENSEASQKNELDSETRRKAVADERTTKTSWKPADSSTWPDLLKEAEKSQSDANWGGRDSSWSSAAEPSRERRQQSASVEDPEDLFVYTPRETSPFIRTVRNFYNQLFWYGAPMNIEAEEEFAGLKFPDIVAFFLDKMNNPAAKSTQRSNPQREKESARSGSIPNRSPKSKQKGTQNPDFPGWQFGWEESGEQSKRPPKSRILEEDGPFMDNWSPSNLKPKKDENLFERLSDTTPLALKSKQRQLKNACSQMEKDLAQVDDRLRVLDVSLEMWYRRMNAMRKRGLTAENQEVKEATARVKELKALGAVLEREAQDLERQMDNCSTNIRRIEEQLQQNS